MPIQVEISETLKELDHEIPDYLKNPIIIANRKWRSNYKDLDEGITLLDEFESQSEYLIADQIIKNTSLSDYLSDKKFTYKLIHISSEYKFPSGNGVIIIPLDANEYWLRSINDGSIIRMINRKVYGIEKDVSCLVASSTRKASSYLMIKLKG